MAKKDVKEESKELAVKGNQDYAVTAEMSKEFEGLGLGAGEEIDTMDIIIPNLMLTQGLTKAVVKGKAPVGKYINATNNDLMGDSLEGIVIHSYKTWQVYKIIENDKDEYIETIEYYGNEGLEYEFKDGNDLYKRKQVLGFYVLLLDEIKEGMAFPYTITFKGGSKKAGRELTSYFAKMRANNLPSFAKVFSFGSELIEDKNTYYAKTVDMGRQITTDELGAVKLWLADLKKNKDKFKVDNAEEREESEEIIVESKVVNEAANGSKF